MKAALALCVAPPRVQLTVCVPVPFVVFAVLVYDQDTAPPASATCVAVMPWAELKFPFAYFAVAVQLAPADVDAARKPHSDLVIVTTNAGADVGALDGAADVGACVGAAVGAAVRGAVVGAEVAGTAVATAPRAVDSGDMALGDVFERLHPPTMPSTMRPPTMTTIALNDLDCDDHHLLTFPPFPLLSRAPPSPSSYPEQLLLLRRELLVRQHALLVQVSETRQLLGC